MIGRLIASKALTPAFWSLISPPGRSNSLAAPGGRATGMCGGESSLLIQPNRPKSNFGQFYWAFILEIVANFISDSVRWIRTCQAHNEARTELLADTMPCSWPTVVT